AATVEAAAAERLAAELPERGRAAPRGQLAHVTRLEGTPWRVVTATPAPDTGLLGLAALAALLVAAGLVAVFARRLAGHLTQPLRELTAAAERVAGGDLATTIAVREPEEVARLAGSFNRMTTELKRNMDALQRSRDEMRESLQRLGETLESTHDLEGLLTLVLEAAADLVGARSGVAYTMESAGTLTRVAQIDRTGSGPGAPRHLPVGSGVLGSVAATARAARGRLGQHLTPADGEPASGEALALPLCRGSQVVGVLALYGRVDGSAFGPAEEEEIATLARQAGIAVDNVLLHREAQRLSITDPLTGIGNFRYLSMSLGRELERAARYGREVAVLMLDLDHFKQVNDTHGHARGDQVLRELAARVSEQIRDIDILARYGGEEFVLVLPETSAQGAATLAERVCAAVRREPFRGEPGAPALRVTASVGVATFPQHGESPATLLRAADAALYEAKAEGRDRMRLAPV
ncbi:MAG: diguanylate cyclase, partial [Actinomycetota bacterium]|nr:diguanylate cyclase [Actinomycetota bacterium]